jgi:ATP/maltotriose-dependent transcriptional regulator MalT
LIAALQQVDRNIGRTIQLVLQSPQLLPPSSLVTPLINAVTAAAAVLTLVLDDYQLITSISGATNSVNPLNSF